jgi:hypothetical protein
MDNLLTYTGESPHAAKDKHPFRTRYGGNPFPDPSGKSNHIPNSRKIITLSNAAGKEFPMGAGVPHAAGKEFPMGAEASHAAGKEFPMGAGVSHIAGKKFPVGTESLQILRIKYILLLLI